MGHFEPPHQSKTGHLTDLISVHCTKIKKDKTVFTLFCPLKSGWQDWLRRASARTPPAAILEGEVLNQKSLALRAWTFVILVLAQMNLARLKMTKALRR